METVNYLKHKRTIEIYFILYLAALVFLLPSKHSQNQNSHEEYGSLIITTPYYLQPEKTTLRCIISDEDGIAKIVTYDSVNHIFFNGDADNVRFEFYVDGLTPGKSVKINPSELTQQSMFRIVERQDGKYAEFYWVPQLDTRENKSYLVNVIAVAKDKKFDSLGHVTNANMEHKVKTQFMLNLIYLKNGEEGTTPQFTGLNQTSGLQNGTSVADLINRGSFIAPDRVSLTGQSEISQVASHNWTNTLLATRINLMTDLLKNPELTIKLEPENNGGEAAIIDRNEDKLILKGKTPSFGKMYVTAKIIRKFDKSEYSYTFSVNPQAIRQPEFDNVMYPEETYKIIPNLPITNQNTKAYLKDGSTVRAESKEGEEFSFTPMLEDTGKIFILERYIDGNPIGQKYQISIQNYPSPVISDIRSKSEKEATVVTYAFGKHSKETNEIVDFLIIGNAKFKDMRGNLKDIKPSTRIQYFQFTPQDASKPFRFTIIAVDRWGRKSVARSLE
jgi:hypothetical protein